MSRILSVLFVMALCAPTAWATPPEFFLKNWPDAQKAAKDQKRPVYIHFTTSWCGWCRTLEKETYADSKVKKAFENFVCVSLDCTEKDDEPAAAQNKANQNLLEQYGGRGYPFLVVTTADGTALAKVSGYLPPEELLKALAAGKDAFTEVQDFQEYAAKADIKTYEYNLRAMRFYTKFGPHDKALAPAQEVVKLDTTNAVLDEAKAFAEQKEYDKAVTSAQAALDASKDPLQTKAVYGFLEALREIKLDSPPPPTPTTSPAPSSSCGAPAAPAAPAPPAKGGG